MQYFIRVTSPINRPVRMVLSFVKHQQYFCTCANKDNNVVLLVRTISGISVPDLDAANLSSNICFARTFDPTWM
jgi:hypothetical protein